MKNSTRDKMARSLIASLLSSDMTQRELAEIAESFITQDRFIREIGFILQEINSRLSISKNGHDPEADFVIPSENSLSSSELESLIKNAGMSHADILHIIEDISPELAFFLSRRRYSTSTLIEKLFTSASTKDRQRVLNALVERAMSTIPTHDPYIEFINEKLHQSNAEK